MARVVLSLTKTARRVTCRRLRYRQRTSSLRIITFAWFGRARSIQANPQITQIKYEALMFSYSFGAGFRGRFVSSASGAGDFCRATSDVCRSAAVAEQDHLGARQRAL